MPNPPRIQTLKARGRKTAPLLALVLGLHAIVLLSLSNLGAWRDRGAQPIERPPLQVWLLEAFKPAPRTETATPPAAPARKPETSRPSATSSPTQAISLPPVEAVPAQPAAETAPMPLPPAQGPMPTEPPPLNLALPRGASQPWRERNPALDDPRSNTRRPTSVEHQIARALGGDPNGPISEEPLADGSVRLRRGRACVIVRPNRSQGLDPYNSSFSPKPRVVDSC